MPDFDHAMEAHARLAEYWVDLTRRLGVETGVRDAVMAGLVAAYSEPGRHYHTLRHIVAMLDQARQITFEDVDTAALAIIFHDVVYDPARQDNETKSAAYMITVLAGHVDGGRLARAGAMIEATKLHQATEDGDTNLVLDLDMGILGQPWPVYEAYARGVMAEYIPVFGAEAYRAGRVALFIEPSLAKDSIFITPDFKALDAQAFANLRREKAWLEAGGA